MDLTSHENMKAKVALWVCRSCYQRLGEHHKATCSLLRPMTSDDLVHSDQAKPAPAEGRS